MIQRWPQIAAFLFLFIGLATVYAAEPVKFLYESRDPGPSDDISTHVQPWATIRLDPDFAGQWIVTGDVDGDGNADVVSARNVNVGDVHFTSSVVAQRLNGDVIWRWGDPAVGRKKLHHDVACQIIDWDRDGKNEVVLLADRELLHLDGRTGRERRRLAIPAEASDCLSFARLSGSDKNADFLVKTRYSQIWAFDYDGKELWTVQNPVGYRTSHQARPIDLDGDGIDEVISGYAILNADGTVRSTYQSKAVDQGRGHLDTCRLVRRDALPNDTRLAITCCGANNIAMINGEGKPVWEYPGYHFESIQVADIVPDLPGKEILVDIDHRKRGESPIWVMSAAGKPITQIISDYCRHHAVVDWDGDGSSEIVIAQSRGLFSYSGERLATFFMEPDTLDSDEQLVLIGDMTGDGIPDVTLSTLSAVYIYENAHGKRSAGGSSLGCGTNHTLY